MILKCVPGSNTEMSAVGRSHQSPRAALDVSGTAEAAGSGPDDRVLDRRGGRQRVAVAVVRTDLQVADRHRRKLIGQRSPDGAGLPGHRVQPRDVVGSPDAAVDRSDEDVFSVRMRRDRVHGPDSRVRLVRNRNRTIRDRRGALHPQGVARTLPLRATGHNVTGMARECAGFSRNFGIRRVARLRKTPALHQSYWMGSTNTPNTTVAVLVVIEGTS